MTQSLPNTSGADKPLTIEDINRDIISAVRGGLIEDYRDGRFKEAAPEMFPARFAHSEVTAEEKAAGVKPELLVDDDGEPIELSPLADEEERAVGAKIKSDVDAFKDSLDLALRKVPAEEHGFIDARGSLWEGLQTTPINDGWLIYSLFDRGESLAVYCLPVKDRDSKGRPVTFTRILISRHSGSASWKPMSLDAFRREVVDEMVGAYYGYYGDDGHTAVGEAADAEVPS